MCVWVLVWKCMFVCGVPGLCMVCGTCVVFVYTWDVHGVWVCVQRHMCVVCDVAGVWACVYVQYVWCVRAVRGMVCVRMCSVFDMQKFVCVWGYVWCVGLYVEWVEYAYGVWCVCAQVYV